MRIEICRHCWKAIITDCSTGLYCSLARDEDPDWIEKIQHQPASPAGCHYIAQKFAVCPRKAIPVNCPFKLEQVMADDETKHID